MTLRLDRDQILAFRRRSGALDDRLSWGGDALRHVAWAGLQDSVPRAALLSIHARIADTPRDALDHPSLSQVWGPRFNVFVVTEQDAAVFTLGRMPDGGPRAERAEEAATRLEELLGDQAMRYGDAGQALGVHPNSLRYATLTGRIRLRWDGARQPTIWIVSAPDIDARDARLELARRYLHVFGPGTADGFGNWAGVRPTVAQEVLAALSDETVPVVTPLGEGRLLASDEESARHASGTPSDARLLPSGDAFFLLWGEHRSMLVPDGHRRDLLWTSRVWPGALLLGGEVAGIWRRSKATITIEPWRRVSTAERESIEVEAMSMPLPESDGEVTIQWA
jgi:hypothetical protein